MLAGCVGDDDASDETTEAADEGSYIDEDDTDDEADTDDEDIRTPNGAFAFEHFPDTGELRISIDSARERFTVSQVHFEGDVDQDGQTWASVADIDPDNLIEVGDVVTLEGVLSDYELSLIYPNEAGQSAEMASNRGPDVNS